MKGHLRPGPWPPSTLLIRGYPHPYRDGVALIGDAAAANDPSYGEGLSLTVRDVRVLRDSLLRENDWEKAGHDYASEHDRHYRVIHEVTQLLTQLFLQRGPAADERRARAFPLIAQDETRVPDHIVVPTCLLTIPCVADSLAKTDNQEEGCFV